ncbi:GUN4 domain-containing protein [Dolichospermum circinale CS-534/05]|uniref:GUN4 domain-containing protein n=1 Tax=Dolichospermum circinale TaxID=109265 RepID=UPI00232B0B6E|nr:GUN4 domain-containing protein [Dolichospermum circinale]MDB9456201.1 GUN4 domain-containing protein [Dolichospermum circinale CS-541/06]MDB9462619.1 GUN4 domain-containing protein [Dolichospermum circinale CS-541/04]MDB9492279.1 GUN4 domain-containing protein [Dolichospermum circinale CS-534/05]MDB9546208.1 GUN4 domain-containing protein [Dolichospermum circinale CS-1031]
MLEEIERLKKSLETENKTKVNYYEQIAYFRQELSITSSSVQKFELTKRIEDAEKKIQDIDIQIESLRKEIGDMEERSKFTQVTPNPIPIWFDISNNPKKKPEKTQEPHLVLEPIVVIEPIIDNQIKEDYTLLHELLTNQQWKEADLETTQIFLKIAKRQKAGWLRATDIANISCSDLRIINQLWAEASQHLFGFNVQRHIWVSVGGEVNRFDSAIFYDFADTVGWRTDNNWLKNYDDFKFSINAPKGHLPSFRFPTERDLLETWEASFKNFLLRLNNCF